MSSASGAVLFINLAAFLTAVLGGILLITLISRRYLDAIAEVIDRTIANEDLVHLLMKTDAPRGSEVAKRIFDLVIAAIALLFFLPMILLIAVAIKVTSQGPVFFAQERIGRSGKRFTAYKFRTMASYMEEATLRLQNAPQTRSDPRITAIGRFLRETTLDELPKLINVLKGDMSLVGTSMAIDFSYFEELTPEIREAITTVKPGLINLWSISGMRWRYNFGSRLVFDLYYVWHQSFILDLVILLMSIPTSLGRAGAR